jgi:hypothetical protein
MQITRRTVLYGIGASAATAAITGCGGSDSTGTLTTSGTNPGGPSTTQNPQPTPAGPLTTASVTVSTTSAGTISSGFAGLSYEKGAMAEPLFEAGNTDLIGMFKGIGPSLLRIGGNSVDKTQWNATGAGRTSGQVAPSDIDALAGFLKASGWTVLYGVNLATSTPAAAAAEVAYAVQSLGSSLYAIEIGNECDLYGDTGSYFANNWTLQDFEVLWGQFRTAILASAPNVVITGPASASHITTWTVPFGQTVGKQEIALLTQHYYRGNGQSASSTDAELITPDTALVTDLSQLNTGATQIGIPFRLTETNSFYNGGASGVSNSYASSLWVIDHLFNIALGGGVGANFHGGGNGTGYTPIANSDGVVVEARPEYYGIKLFTLAGTGALLDTIVSASSLNVTAYAVKSAAGGLDLIVINKDSTQNLNLTVNCGQTVATATLLEMSGPALDATTGVTIQGAAIGQDGSFKPQTAYTLTASGSNVTCYVPALSAVLIAVS